MKITDHYVDSVDTTWGDPIKAFVCKQCGALVHHTHLDVHIKWHANAGPVRAFREHWRRTCPTS